MLRKFRGIAPLCSSLLLGAIALPTGLVVATTLVGCRDENDPATYVADLSDPGKQTAAMKRLIQFYEDAMTKDKKNRQGPAVKPILDKIVEPMTKLCTDAKDLQERTRSTLVKFLADSQDPRATPCLVKTLTDYKQGTNEEDVQQVMRSISQTKNKDTADAVVKVFSMIKVSDPKAALIYPDVMEATLVVATSAHEDTFIKLIEAPVPDDEKDTAGIKNQTFWQGISCRVLGNLRSVKAVKPLIKAILTPNKSNGLSADIANNALTALVKIGKPAIGPAQALLQGKDADLIKYSTEQNLKDPPKEAKDLEKYKKAAEKAHISWAAQILGALGREDSVAPLLSAIDGADDSTKAVIALQLPSLPNSDQTVTAFKSIYESTKLDTNLPNGSPAKPALADAASGFVDASFVPWMLKQAADMKAKVEGDQETIDQIKQITFQTSMKLMKPEQVVDVEALYHTKVAVEGKPNESTELGKAYEKEFKLSKAVLEKCKTDAKCYLEVMTLPGSQNKEGQFTGIKAGYMVMIFGKPDIKAAVVDALPKLQNAAVRFVALTVIDELSPKGDKEIADKLQSIADKAIASKDQEAIGLNGPFKDVIARLNARAQ